MILTENKELTQDTFFAMPMNVKWAGVDYDGTLHFGSTPGKLNEFDCWVDFERSLDPVLISGYLPMTSLTRTFPTVLY